MVERNLANRLARNEYTTSVDSTPGCRAARLRMPGGHHRYRVTIATVTAARHTDRWAVLAPKLPRGHHQPDHLTAARSQSGHGGRLLR